VKHFSAMLIFSLGCLLLAVTRVLAADELVRPMIWVTPAERAPILAKIQSQPWAKAAFDAMKDRVQSAVAQHEKSPDGFLRGLPLVWNKAASQLPPTLARVDRDKADKSDEADAGAGGKLQKFLLIGEDCGVLYFLTRDEAYARCAADILNASIEAMVQMKPNESAGNGGLIYPDDHLYEARAIGAQLPIVYDFVQPYLKTGAPVYNLVTKGQTAFNFAHAQTVFRTYARLAVEHGLIDCNWPVLEMPSLAHNALALDDPVERARMLEYVVSKNTAHQDSLEKVLVQYAQRGAVWPESFQYSSGVSSLATYLVALMQRQGAMSELPTNYVRLPLSLARLNELRFPNGDSIRFGDGPRKLGGAYNSYEIAYALGLRVGNTNLQQTFGGLINLGVAQGDYRREVPHGDTSGPSINLGPLQLLWFAPEVTGQMTPPTPQTTDELPFVGAVLQLNLSPDQSPNHALMAVVSGGSHVHSHASGMALELYGDGEVLGTDSGKGSYGKADHENYRRLFAAYNCVIVNGASRSEGGWVNLGINTVQKVALEPAVGALPVSRNDSFTLTSFDDDKGPDAKARQERLVGIVRTSATTGYYVDVFRSRSARPNQFHDYLYHNLGEAPVIMASGNELQLAATPGRFAPVSGAVWKSNHSYLFPGWQYFQEVKTSAPCAADVTVDFTASRLRPAPANMRLFIPGAAGREYSQAFAPATKEAPPPYDHQPDPVLVIRQHGEAWTHPFAVVFEPSAGDKNSGSVQSVTTLGDENNFAGFQVISRIAGQPLTQYVLVQPTATSGFEDAKLGISFRGRYAVITVNASGACTSLYLGEGSRLRFQNYNLTSAADARTAASAELSGPTATLFANSPVELTLPGGQRIASAFPPH